MGQIIKFEFIKLWSRKIVWIGLLFLLAFSVFTLCVGLDGRQYTVITPKGEVLSGEDGKIYIKERIRHYAGLLNDTKKEEVLKTERAADIDEYAYLDSLPLYTALNEMFGSQYSLFYGKTIDEVFTRNGITVEVGNTGRWTSVFYYFQQSVIILGFIITIAVSGIFSEEYTRRTDALLLTSRHGKKKCVWAKITAAFLFSAGCYLILFLLNAIPFLLDDGLYGWDAGIQLDLMNGLYNVPYTMNCAQASFAFVGGGFLSLMMLTALTLIISVFSKSSFVSIIVSAVLYFIPMLLSNICPDSVTCLTPVGAGTTMGLSLPGFTFLGIKMVFQVKILAVAAVMVVLSWIFTRKAFARHQVA